MAPAKTGSLVTKSKAVKERAQSIRGKRSKETNFVVREQRTVVRKLILPKIEEIPAR